MLRLIGGWGNRPDPLRSCAERLVRSLDSMPSQPERYGSWGVWQPRPESAYNDLVPLDDGDVEAVEGAIKAVTERVNQGPMPTPGHHMQLAREVVGERADADPQYLEYTVRAGFVDTPQPFNHLLLQAEDSTDPAELFNYMSALVAAWQPDQLGLATRAVQRAQGHRPPEAIVGLLTYVRAGTPLKRGTLDGQIDVAEADGGLYIRVPGTPERPSLDHVRRVREALGYSNPQT